MTGVTERLYLCYATKESGGNSADDYVALSQTVRHLAIPRISPTRTIEGAHQVINMAHFESGDLYAFTLDSHCNGMGNLSPGSPHNYARPNRTATYTSENATLDGSMLGNSSVYRICYKPAMGLWTHVSSQNLNVEAKPSFSPLYGVAGMVTPLSFIGHLVGDFVVLTVGSCATMSPLSTPTTATSMARQLVRDGLASPNVGGGFAGSIATAALMNRAEAYTLCYASMQSLGDTIDDYVALPTNFTNRLAVSFSPTRVVLGSEQRIKVTGSRNGDSVFWTLRGECPGTGYDGTAKSYSTATFLLTGAGGAGDEVTLSTLTVDASLAAQTSYIMCYKPGGNNGRWTHVTGKNLLYVSRPGVMSPVTAVAGMPTVLSFQTTETYSTGPQTPLDGDFIVIAENCGTAWGTGTGVRSLGKTAINTTSNAKIVRTTSAMTGNGTLLVCFATQESGGDSIGDYVQAGVVGGTLLTLTQRNPVTFSPARAIAGANQVVEVYDTRTGDLLVWRKDACDSGTSGTASATTEFGLTSTVLSSHGTTVSSVALNTNLDAGVYNMCYKPTATGLWTHVVGKTLLLVAIPSFTPLTSVAGIATPIAFAGSGFLNGDFVVMQQTAGGCANAHQTSTGPTTLAKSALSTGVSVPHLATSYSIAVTTNASMTASGELTLCVASSESGGDSGDDYVALPTRLKQVPQVTLNFARAISGAAQTILVSGSLDSGDGFAWSTASHCNGVSVGQNSSTTQTGGYSVSGQSPFAATINTNLVAAEYTMCFRPTAAGLWTKIDSAKLTLVGLPSYSPPVGVAGMPTPVTFTGSGGAALDIVVGDFVVFQENNCNNAHLATSIDGFQYYRFVPLKQRSSLNSIQIADFEFQLGASVVSTASVLASNPGGSTGANHGASKAVDGNAATKWRDGSTQAIIFDFQTKTKIDKFAFKTGDVGAEWGEDPVRWLFEGSHHGGVNGPWYTLHDQSSADFGTPAGRQTLTAFHSMGVGGAMGGKILPRTQLALDGMNKTVSTTTSMDGVTTLAVCYASHDSGGDSPDDYASLVQTFSQVPAPLFAPNRTVAGALQALTITGGVSGSELVLRQDTGPMHITICTDLPAAAGTPGANITAVYPINSNLQSIYLHASLSPGHYTVCYKPASNGIWTKITKQRLNLVSRPSEFHPVNVVAGMPTPINFTGGYNGDFIVMQPNNCNNAHLVTNSSNGTMARVRIVNMGVTTTTIMDGTVALKLCYAAMESGGNSGDDYVEISYASLSPKAPVVFSPMRIMEGSLQAVVVTGGEAGDKLAFTSKAVCTGLNEAGEAVDQSPVFTIGGGSHTATMTGNQGSGEYITCYKPAGADSLWTHVTHSRIGVINILTMTAKPTFSPITAVASHVTPIAFTGSGGMTDILNGDYVVMQTGNCLNAHSAITGVQKLARTSIESGVTAAYITADYNKAVTTTVLMTTATQLVVCFATQESGGDTSDDYVQLAATLNQVAVPAFSPKRTGFGGFLNDGDQLYTISNVLTGNRWVWLQHPHWTNCDTLDPNTTLTASATHSQTYLAASSGPLTLSYPSSTMVGGTYRLCFLPTALAIPTLISAPGGGAVMELVVVAPTFGPIQAIFGMPEMILIAGAADGDLIVIQPLNCANAHTRINSASAMAVQAIEGTETHGAAGVGRVNTSTLFNTNSEGDNEQTFFICYATQESGANSADDYVAIHSGLTMRVPISFDPVRIAESAPQVVVVTKGFPNDLIVWTREQDCSYLPTEPTTSSETPSRSAVYNVTGPSMSVTMHTGMTPGAYRVCYRTENGVWTHVTSQTLTVMPKPSGFAPLTVVAGMKVPINFTGGHSGDFIVFHQGPCHTAHTVTTGQSSMGPTGMVSATGQGSASVDSPIAMGIDGERTKTFNVCYATLESGGDEPGDYALLNSPITLTQSPAFFPMRAFAGASQVVEVHHGIGADRYMFIHSQYHSCSKSLTMDQSPSSTKTGSVYVADDMQPTVLPTYLLPGIYTLCYKPTETQGIWTQITGKELILAARPTSYPTTAVAGIPTPISVGGFVTSDLNRTRSGDFVVIQETNCNNAHTRVTGIKSLGKTALSSYSTDTNSGNITTTTAMTGTGPLVVCIASQESGGNSTDDFVALSTGLDQVQPVVFSPKRTMSVAPQIFSILSGVNGDGIAWTKAPDCKNLGNTGYSSATRVYTVTGSPYKPVLHTSPPADAPSAGTYRMCYRPTSTGIWERIPTNDLIVVGIPTFSPLTAVAGMPTPISFSTAQGSKPGDFAVLQPNNCNNANATVTGGAALGATSLSSVSTDTNSGHVLTTAAMTTPGDLKLCYATHESGGDSPDDYTLLAAPLTQVAPVTFAPNRAMEGSSQSLSLSGGLNGDAVAWTKKNDCTQHKASAQAASTSLTAVYAVTSGASVSFVLHGSGKASAPANASPSAGVYRMCYRPTATGLWTHITGNSLNIVHVPTFSPLSGVATTVTKLSFDSPDVGLDIGIKDGDFIKLTPSSCSDASFLSNLATTGVDELAKTATSTRAINTAVNMTADARLYVCYATSESGGNSIDDFLELSVPYRQSSPMYWMNSPYNNNTVVKNRVPAGAQTKMAIRGSATGRVALVRNSPGVSFSCAGAHQSQDTFDGTKIYMPVTGWYVTLPGNPSLGEGDYSVCLCGSSDYPGCVNDYEYSPGFTGVFPSSGAKEYRASPTTGPLIYSMLGGGGLTMRGDTLRVVTKPRMGPVSNPGNIRNMRHTDGTFRIAQDLSLSSDLGLFNGSVLAGDLVYAASSCYTTIPAAHGTVATTLMMLGGYNSTERSALITLPDTFHVEDALTLQLCFTTRELARDMLTVDDFVKLPDTLTVHPEPHFYGSAAVRMLHDTDPDFKLYGTPPGNALGIENGDKIYFGASCNATCSHLNCSMLPTVGDITAGGATPVLVLDSHDPVAGTAKVHLPEADEGGVQLRALGVNCKLNDVRPENPGSSSECYRRSLATCYQSHRAEGKFFPLDISPHSHPHLSYTNKAELHIEPHPVADIMDVYDRGNLFQLPFTGGYQGDYFMLKVGDCSGVRDTFGLLPGGPSYMTQLEADGVARERAIAYSMINELKDGTYKICYATKSSEADSNEDFEDLSREIRITEKANGRSSVAMEVSTIGLGGYALVNWESTRGFESGLSSDTDWIGIYKKGECSEPELFESVGTNQVIAKRVIETDPSSRHKCYLEAKNIGGGATTGQVKFKLEYAGEYEARFFRGDSRHGQGYVCKRISGSGASTYLQCVLQQSAVSDFVTVKAQGFPASFSEDTPGLEVISQPYMY